MSGKRRLHTERRLEAKRKQHLVEELERFNYGSCVIKGCTSTITDDVPFTTFPMDEKKREVWVRACKLKGKSPTFLDRAQLCFKHFSADWMLVTAIDKPIGGKTNIHLLKSGAVPTVFPWALSTETEPQTASTVVIPKIVTPKNSATPKTNNNNSNSTSSTNTRPKSRRKTQDMESQIVTTIDIRPVETNAGQLQNTSASTIQQGSTPVKPVQQHQYSSTSAIQQGSTDVRSTPVNIVQIEGSTGIKPVLVEPQCTSKPVFLQGSTGMRPIQAQYSSKPAILQGSTGIRPVQTQNSRKPAILKGSTAKRPVNPVQAQSSNNPVLLQGFTDFRPVQVIPVQPQYTSKPAILQGSADMKPFEVSPVQTQHSKIHAILQDSKVTRPAPVNPPTILPGATGIRLIAVNPVQSHASLPGSTNVHQPVFVVNVPENKCLKCSLQPCADCSSTEDKKNTQELHEITGKPIHVPSGERLENIYSGVLMQPDTNNQTAFRGPILLPSDKNKETVFGETGYELSDREKTNIAVCGDNIVKENAAIILDTTRVTNEQSNVNENVQEIRTPDKEVPPDHVVDITPEKEKNQFELNFMIFGTIKTKKESFLLTGKDLELSIYPLNPTGIHWGDSSKFKLIGEGQVTVTEKEDHFRFKRKTTVKLRGNYKKSEVKEELGVMAKTDTINNAEKHRLELLKIIEHEQLLRFREVCEEFKVFYCNWQGKCTFMSTSKEEITSHVTQHYSSFNIKFVCHFKKCRNMMKDFTVFIKHLRTHSYQQYCTQRSKRKTWVFPCGMNKCQEKFKSFQSLKSHVEKHYSSTENYFLCFNCGDIRKGGLETLTKCTNIMCKSRKSHKFLEIREIDVKHLFEYDMDSMTISEAESSDEDSEYTETEESEEEESEEDLEPKENDAQDPEWSPNQEFNIPGEENKEKKDNSSSDESYETEQSDVDELEQLKDFIDDETKENEEQEGEEKQDQGKHKQNVVDKYFGPTLKKKAHLIYMKYKRVSQGLPAEDAIENCDDFDSESEIEKGDNQEKDKADEKCQLDKADDIDHDSEKAMEVKDKDKADEKCQLEKADDTDHNDSEKAVEVTDKDKTDEKCQLEKADDTDHNDSEKAVEVTGNDSAMNDQNEKKAVISDSDCTNVGAGMMNNDSEKSTEKCENDKELSSQECSSTADTDTREGDSPDVSTRRKSNRKTSKSQSNGETSTNNVNEERSEDTTENTEKHSAASQSKNYCQVCEKTFRSRKVLQKHIESLHKGMDDTDSEPPKKRRRKGAVSPPSEPPKIAPKFQRKKSHSLKYRTILEHHGTYTKEIVELTKDTAQMAVDLIDSLNKLPSIIDNKHRSPKTATKCSFCHRGRLYRSKIHFANHLESHFKEHYTCNCCQKMLFQSVEEVEEHIKTHDKEKKGVCVICGLLVQSKRMASHVKGHGGFPCTWEGCKVICRKEYSLKLHMMIHTGEKLLKCEFCDYECIQRNSMHWHMKSKHNTITITSKDKYLEAFKKNV